MDGVLSILAVVVGLLVIAWLCGPAGPQGRPARQETDQTSSSDAYMRFEDRSPNTLHGATAIVVEHKAGREWDE